MRGAVPQGAPLAWRTAVVGVGRLRWFAALLLATLVLWAQGLTAQAASTAAKPDYRFRPAPEGGPLSFNAAVLTEDERRFLEQLPEIRVAIPLPAARPYEVIGEDGLITGVHPDLLVALSQLFGLRLKPVVLPSWSDMLEAARRREVDLVMSIGVTSERLEYLAYTLGTTPLPGALFARAGARIDMATASYAVERNFVAQDWLRRQYPQARLVVVDTTIEALRAVGLGEADAYMGSLLAATDWLTREPVPGVELNRFVSYGTGHYHFAVRKDWAMLAAILNKGIQSLRTSPEGLLPTLGPLPEGASWPRRLSPRPEEAALLAQRPVWRVGAVRGLSLLNEVNEAGTHSGIAAEYTEQVARRLGVGVQVVPFESVAAMLDGLRRREIDLVPFLTRTPSREREFRFSRPYVEMPYMLVGRSDGLAWWNLASLEGRRLALAPQHPLRELLAERYPGIQVVEAPPGTGAMDLVADGKAEAAVDVKLFANLRINGPGGESLRLLSQVDELPAQFHFATREGEPALLSLVDRALADIPQGERDRMLRRWVAVDLQPAFPWRRHLPVIVLAGGALLLLGAGTLWWARRLQREVTARRRSEQLLSDIAASVPGVAFRYLLDGTGKLRHHYFSPGARRLLGIDLDPKATVLQTVSGRLTEEERADAEAQELRSVRTGEPFRVTCRYAHPDGRPRWLQVEALMQRRPGSAEQVWTGYVVDVTSERELQQRLADEARARNLLLASASHELRAPTHTLSLALQSMPREGLDAEQQRALRIAQDGAHTLSELLNDVLDVARSGHDALALRPRDFDLHQLLEDLARAWRSAARTRGLTFQLDIGPGVPRTMVADPLRLKQVLTNLLSNACKYTPTGSVQLQAMRESDGALCFVVSDTGPGIDVAAQALLFKPYVTLDAEPAPGQGRSGLGLATSRQLAERMGGRLTLDSTPGQGTRVSLWLPAPTVVVAAWRPVGAVLVCDDDETSRMLLAAMLRRQGLEILEAADGESALARWREGGVSALITDLDLPGLHGLEVLARLRRHEAEAGGPATPVVVCSGTAMPEPGPGDDASAAAAPRLWDAYLVKPVELPVLEATLRRLGLLR